MDVHSFRQEQLFSPEAICSTLERSSGESKVQKEERKEHFVPDEPSAHGRCADCRLQSAVRVQRSPLILTGGGYSI